MAWNLNAYVLCQWIQFQKFGRSIHFTWISQEEYKFSVNDIADDTPATATDTTIAVTDATNPTITIADDNDDQQNLSDSSTEEEPNINEHQNSHSNLTCREKKRHACKKCNRSFDRPHKLVLHIKDAHEGIRFNKCDQCNKSYVSAYELKVHARTHTGRSIHLKCIHKLYQQLNFMGKLFYFY